MTLLALRSAIYFAPARAATDVARALRSAITESAVLKGLGLRAMDDLSRDFLDGDDAAFTETYDLMLLYDDPDDAAEHSLHITLREDAGGSVAALFVVGDLPEVTPDQVDLAWRRLTAITVDLANAIEPEMALLNGLRDEDEEYEDEEEDASAEDLPSPTALEPGRLPPFFTPFTFLGRELGQEAATALEAVNGVRVEQTSAGWAMWIVPRFGDPPAERVVAAIAGLPGSPGFHQTPVGP